MYHYTMSLFEVLPLRVENIVHPSSHRVPFFSYCTHVQTSPPALVSPAHVLSFMVLCSSQVLEKQSKVTGSC